jgi:hypothetical protein
VKRFLLFISLILTSFCLFAQEAETDTIVSRDGSRTEAVVIEINSSEVVYQTREGGPYYVLSVDDVSEVIFSNGFRQDLTGEKIVPFNRAHDTFPGVMSCYRAHLYLDGQMIPETTVWKVISVNKYWSSYHEQMRKWRAGRILTFSGLGCIAAAGAICAWDYARCKGSDITVSEWTTEFGVELGAAGVLMTGGGLVLKHIGKSRIEDLVRWYNAEHGKYPEVRNSSPSAQLTLGFSPAGATLALTF